MNVLLISANREDINMLTLPMGLACVAAALEKAGHAVRFLDLISTAVFLACTYPGRGFKARCYSSVI